MAKSSIKANFTYQMIYEILLIILPFVTSPYLSRVVGAEGLGIYSYSHSVAYYFVLVSMLGLKNYGNRAIARVRDDKESLNKTFSNILAVHIIISLICIFAYILYIIMLDEKIYAIIQTAYVASGLFDISWFYFGIEKFKMTVARSSIIKILNVLLIFLMVKSADDLWIYCLIMALGMLFSQMILWVPLKRYVTIVRPTREGMQVHIKPMFILFLPAIAVSMYKYMDKIMIGLLSSKTQLGYYENAEKVNQIPVTIIGSFGTVMLPKMSNLAAKADKKVSARYTAVSMQFVMCLALALAFGLAGVGQTFAPVFWGSDFVLSGTIIMGLSATIPFTSFANVIRTQYLIPNQKDREYLSSVVAGAIVNVVINALLIPQYGAMGATVGTIAAEVTVCLIQAFVVRKELPLISYIKSFLYFIFIGVVMFVIVYSLGNSRTVSIPTLILQIAVGGVFYCVMALIYFLRTKNEVVINMTNGLLKKLKISYRLK